MKTLRIWHTFGSFVVILLWFLATLVSIVEFFMAKMIGTIGQTYQLSLGVILSPIFLSLLIGFGRFLIARLQQLSRFKNEQVIQEKVLTKSLKLNTLRDDKSNFINLLTVDSKNASPMLIITMTSLIAGGLSFLAALVYCLMISLKLTICVLFLCLFGLLIPKLNTKGLKNAQDRQQNFSGTVQRSLLQILDARILLASFQAQEYGLHLFKSHYNNFANAQYQTGIKRIIMNSIGIGMGFVFDISILAVELLFVGLGNISITQYAAISILTPSFTWLFYSMPGIYAELIRNSTSALRVVDFIYSSDNISHQNHSSIKSIAILKLDHVSFTYPGSNKKVFQNISLKINVKDVDKVLITGPSGGGKSTLVKLIMNQLQPQAGTITNIAENGAKSLVENQQIGYIPQKNEIFDDTLLNNLTLDRKVTSSEIAAAIQRVGLTDFIKTLPQGLETNIGNNINRNLSSGQTQKIGIVRALLSNRSLLIMDEPFANLDPESAKNLAQALKKLPLSLIVISHRLDFSRFWTKHYLVQSNTIEEVNS
ncbi:ATP-binding cassette domain-containing protein [Oenococcus oeni]|uniref:ATP-binding cassette domain-containing protein n=1 Tax=Oenococcus oeni TaxID=1247 RepID=UPI0010B2759E|nr:ABC transporter ATP-binding protein [Oenococcus oeni]SYW14178.1 conserved membrane hypothetical protein [Oenococcus oeni]